MRKAAELSVASMNKHVVNEYDAQLADRSTKGYDLLVGRAKDPALKKVQVKSVRAAPWFVPTNSFAGALARQVTVYVMIGPETATKPIRYFIVKNKKLAAKPLTQGRPPRPSLIPDKRVSAMPRPTWLPRASAACFFCR